MRFHIDMCASSFIDYLHVELSGDGDSRFHLPLLGATEHFVKHPDWKCLYHLISNNVEMRFPALPTKLRKYFIYLLRCDQTVKEKSQATSKKLSSECLAR